MGIFLSPIKYTNTKRPKQNFTINLSCSFYKEPFVFFLMIPYMVVLL